MKYPRKHTERMLELLNEGFISPESLAKDLLNWLSDDEVLEFAEANNYFDDEE